MKRRWEYRVGLKSGQGMYIIAKTAKEARGYAVKMYIHRYLNGKNTAKNRAKAKARISSVKRWKKVLVFE